LRYPIGGSSHLHEPREGKSTPKDDPPESIRKELTIAGKVTKGLEKRGKEVAW
jgi:hypothetical protein